MPVYCNSNIPDAAHQFIVSNLGAGIAAIAFTPTGGWVGVTANGIYQASGIPQDCYNTLVQCIGQGWKIKCIAFPPQPAGAWVIIGDVSYYAHNIPNDCYAMIGQYYNNKWPVTCVAFPPSGSDSWAVIGNNAFNASNIDDECFQFLCNYTQGPRRALQVTFTPGGGWIVYGGDTFYARNIDNGCYNQLVTFSNNQHWLLGHIAFTPGGGYSIVCNQQNPYASSDPIRTFETDFYQDSAGKWHTVWDRMASYGVPGASVGLVQGNSVAWTTAYGRLQAGGSQYVYPDTAFQAASVSKPHCAAGIVLLAQKGSIGLGDPIGNHTTWTVPLRSCVQSQTSWPGLATIQLVLQHSGGFIGRGNTYPLDKCSNFTAGQGGGFGGYPDVPGVQLPTLSQVLAGSSPANSPKIEITTQPGTFYYSGMGFVVLMRMLQDVTGADFATWMGQHILGPCGMGKSAYGITLPASLSRGAAGHDTNSHPIPGLRNRYPELSAAGLYTNAGDLCCFVAMLNNAGKAPNGTQVLSSTTAKNMLAQQLGIFTANPATQTNYLFNHNGSNYGFSSFMQGYPNLGAGFAILVNLDDGASKASGFYNEAVAALKRIYSLP
ncbi:MAG TPA: serine hydrolase domain-containing protein [Opitutaceae bacterium]|jgi:CubicO group peptidase (beta-lactamase class C family)|nr:serine hydrolase domain-containing protein [Opitutaceae bacterium]